MLHRAINGFSIIFVMMLTIVFAAGVVYAQKTDTGSGKISVGSSDGTGKSAGFTSGGVPSPYDRPSIGNFGRTRPPSMVDLPDDVRARRNTAAMTSTVSPKFTKSSSTVIPMAAPPNLGPDPFQQPVVVGPESPRRVPLVSNEPTKAPEPARTTTPGLVGWAPDSPRRVPLVSNEPTKVPEPAGAMGSPDSIRRVPLVSNEPTKDPQPAGLTATPGLVGWAPDSPVRVPLVSNEPTQDLQPASQAAEDLPIRRGVTPGLVGWAPDSPRRVPLVSNEPTKDPQPASPATQMLPIRRGVTPGLVGWAPDSPRRVPLVSNEPTKDPAPARPFKMSVVVTDPYERVAAPAPTRAATAEKPNF